MVRAQKSLKKTTEQIRAELLADLDDAAKHPAKEHPPVKNIYNYHPDCPYADKNTGSVLESYYQYWRYYPKNIIQKDETIKHLNNDRTDNRIENLIKGKKQHTPDDPVCNHMPLFVRRKKMTVELDYIKSSFRSLDDYLDFIKQRYDVIPSLGLLFPKTSSLDVAEYISYDRYCPKFNDAFKEGVRRFFNNTCMICGHVWDGAEDRLSVHHVYYNKKACCEILVDGRYVHTLPTGFRLIVKGNPNKFVPLCKRCHSKTNTDRLKWAKYFENIINSMYSGKSYYTVEERDLIGITDV